MLFTDRLKVFHGLLLLVRTMEKAVVESMLHWSQDILVAVLSL